MRFIRRWLRRSIVVVAALVAGWVCAGYAEGYLPGTVAHSTVIGVRPVEAGSQSAAATQPATQPTAIHSSRGGAQQGRGRDAVNR